MAINKCKWALIVKAPLSASGHDEVIFMAEFKKDIQKVTGRKQFGPSSRWAIVPIKNPSVFVDRNDNGN